MHADTDTDRQTDTHTHTHTHTQTHTLINKHTYLTSIHDMHLLNLFEYKIFRTSSKYFIIDKVLYIILSP